jgi:DNA-binding LacI/PurR family transcriptional regulator
MRANLDTAVAARPERLKMADIARLAEVSVSTVSRALAGSPLIPQASREKIEAIAREHGYVVNASARNLRLQTTRAIGLVLPMTREDGRHVTDPFLLEFIGHLSDAVVTRGYDLLLTRLTQPREGWLNELVQSHRFDGMLVIGQHEQHAALNDIAQRYKPMVVWGEQQPNQAYCTVGSDNLAGGRMAVEHLLASGRKRIRFLGDVSAPEMNSRYAGYLETMRAAVPDADEEFLEPISTRPTESAAYAAMRAALARKGDFDAIFAGSDVIAHGARRAFADWGGKVPDDCAFVGFDDVSLAKFLTPPLTTVRQDLASAAGMMVDMLMQRLTGKETPSHVIPVNLIARESSAPKRG